MGLKRTTVINRTEKLFSDLALYMHTVNNTLTGNLPASRCIWVTHTLAVQKYHIAMAHQNCAGTQGRRCTATPTTITLTPWKTFSQASAVLQCAHLFSGLSYHQPNRINSKSM